MKEEQSLHDLSCNGDCKKLKWNEASYRSVEGPTAVTLRSSSGDIQCTAASESTLAISHVWSHGQGSRPNTGLNECLHKRDLEIALAYDCDSYWIDSLCIPESHDLRMEAIHYINRIFADSRITLVCDRDIMDIDITNLTTELLESVLATFFVCDWNVRAWTLLEAMKGSHSIYLLIKFNRILSLRDALTWVHQEETIDIAILSFTTRHLLPTSTEAFRRSSSRQSIEEAGSLLSRRHATRTGDDIVIWSLLSNIGVFNSAEKMWRSKVKARVATAYLMSTAPRLENTLGFLWAPSTPYIRLDSSIPTRDLLGPYNSYESADSELGLITDNGLLAEWLVHLVRTEDGDMYREAPATMTTVTSDGKRTEKNIEGIKIKNYCWQIAEDLKSEYKHVALIQPLSFRRPGRYRAAKNRGETHGEVFAIVVSHDEERWLWKGVRAWAGVETLPPMVTDELLIV